MHKTSWNDLKCVLAVAEEGSVKAASTALGVNHATVLRRIAAFEERHGLRLFRRDPTGYRAEPSAAPILSALRTVGKDVEVVERLLASRGTALEGPVRVTSTDSLAMSVLPRLIADLNAALPGIRPSLATTNRRLDLDQLDAEVTIRPARVMPPDLYGIDAGALAFRVYGSVEYLKENPSGEIADHLWLIASEALSGAPSLTWQSRIPDANIVAEADSFVDLVRLAGEGLGLAVLPCCVSAVDQRVTIADQFPDRMETRVWVAAHTDLVNLPRIAGVMSIFERGLAAARPLLTGTA